METSDDFNSIIAKYKLEKRNDTPTNHDRSDIRLITSINDDNDDDLYNIVDVETLDFDNEETWLYTCKTDSCPGFDVTKWLRTAKSPTAINSFDARTFTRSKKQRNASNNVEGEANVPHQTHPAPLQFDLSQPVGINNFDQILESAADCYDSFQNMSPPSLCSNSMCSSTMTNLMESSYIKLDFESDSEVIPLQDDRNLTFVKSYADDASRCNENDASSKYNTYNKRTSTFSVAKLSVAAADEQINGTFILPQQDVTKTLPDADTNVTFTKNTTTCRFQKLSDSQPDLTTHTNRTVLLEKNPNGSSDSLDERLSCFSDSGKETHHIFNVEDWEAIAKSQELSLQQGISTPKPNAQRLYRFKNDVEKFLSPIVKPTLSDSDISVASSAEDCVTLHSGSSKASSHGSLPGAFSSRLQRGGFVKPEPFVQPMVTQRRAIVPPSMNPSCGPRSVPIVRPSKPSGLPRPSSATTGIPRPTSRIPAPKSFRPTASATTTAASRRFYSGSKTGSTD